MRLLEQMVPSSTDIYNDISVCPDCLDPVGACTCIWKVMQLEPAYSIYTSLNDVTNKSQSASSLLNDDVHKLDGLNCGGIPTRTTPTLTPTTLRNIATDIANLSPAPNEDFAAAAVSDLHHLVSSSVTADRLNSDLQDHHSLQNLGNQHLSLQNLNNQHITLTNLQNHQHLNQNSLNQQQRNDYNNSFSSATSRQACFVPPLVLQINSSNVNIQQPTGTTVLLNNTNSGSSSIFSTKDSSTLASSSHWQGAVVTQRPQRGVRNTTRQRFTDDEDGDEDYDSGGDEDSSSSDTNCGKMASKNTKNNKSSSKARIKSEFKNTANASNNIGNGRRTNNKDNKMMSAEEHQRRQIRRERNKLAAARCRKRRMDHTNELLEETEQLEDKKSRLQDKIQNLLQQKTDLEQMLAHHKCSVNMNNGSISNQTTINTAVLDSNEMSESVTVLSSNLLATKRHTLQENINTNVNSENNSNNIGNILIKCEDLSGIQSDNDNKDDIDIIPTTVMHQSQRRRPTSLLQLNNSNFGSKKLSVNGVKVLNFDSLMDGGTGLTPVSTTGGSVQSHQHNIQRSGVNTSNDSILS